MRWPARWVVRPGWRCTSCCGATGFRPQSCATDWWQLRAELAPVFHVGLPGAAENIATASASCSAWRPWPENWVPGRWPARYAFSFIGIILLNGLAIGFGVEILVGHMIGAGNLHGANWLVKRALAWGLLVTVAVAGGFAIFAKPLFSLYTQDPELLSSAPPCWP